MVKVTYLHLNFFCYNLIVLGVSRHLGLTSGGLCSWRTN